MKISVIGRGNAGCFTALHFAYYTKERDDVEIELFYNPDIPTEKVGQATLLEAPNLLWYALGSNWHNNDIESTIKSGILYEGWGKKKDKIYHPFPYNAVSIHYSPPKLQEAILNSGWFSVKEGDIKDYSSIDSDYVFDSTGKPTLDGDKDWQNYEELKNPLNSCLLGSSNRRDKDAYWTRTVATPDGWCFVIPNTTNTTSYGYLYNDNITSEDGAIKNFKEIFDIDYTDKLSFNKYVAKEPVIDDRVILTGNKLFFIEPLEATACQTYLEWARYIFDCAVLKRFPFSKAVDGINKYIHQIENFILWHYQFGSKYDTPFWDYAKTLKIEDKEFDDLIKYASETDPKFLRDIYFQPKNDDHYGQWRPWNIRCWYDGVYG